MVQIVPAILETDEQSYAELVGHLNSLESLEGATIQIDITDGQFVDNKTISWEIIEKYPLTFAKEIHLMVKDPKNWISRVRGLKCKRVLVHLEADEIDEALNAARQAHLEVGVVLNPQTNLEKVRSYLQTVSVIQLMGVSPGSQGQSFLPETIERVKELSLLRQDSGADFQIAVDGGIDVQVAPILIDAGADILVIGSHLVKGDIESNLEQIWETIYA